MTNTLENKIYTEPLTEKEREINYLVKSKIGVDAQVKFLRSKRQIFFIRIFKFMCKLFGKDFNKEVNDVL